MSNIAGVESNKSSEEEESSEEGKVANRALATEQFPLGKVIKEEREEEFLGKELLKGEGLLEREGLLKGEGLLEGDGFLEGEGLLKGEGFLEGEGLLKGEGFLEGEGLLKGGSLSIIGS